MSSSEYFLYGGAMSLYTFIISAGNAAWTEIMC